MFVVLQIICVVWDSYTWSGVSISTFVVICSMEVTNGADNDPLDDSFNNHQGWRAYEQRGLY